MGDLTLSGFRDELAVMFKNRADPDFTSATRQNRWINAAYAHLTHPAVHRFREVQGSASIAMVAGQVEYQLDATTLGFKLLAARSWVYYMSASATRDNTATHWNLYPISTQQMDRQAATTNDPRQYAIDGEVVTFNSQVPTASVGYRVWFRYWKQPDVLAVDGATTLLPRIWDEVILEGAKWFAENALGYGEHAEATKQNYVSLINEFGGAGETEQLEAEDEGFSVQVVNRPVIGVQ